MPRWELLDSAGQTELPAASAGRGPRRASTSRGSLMVRWHCGPRPATGSRRRLNRATIPRRAVRKTPAPPAPVGAFPTVGRASAARPNTAGPRSIASPTAVCFRTAAGPGSVVGDVYVLQVPPWLPPAEYELQAGLYAREGQQRLALPDGPTMALAGPASWRCRPPAAG